MQRAGASSERQEAVNGSPGQDRRWRSLRHAALLVVAVGAAGSATAAYASSGHAHAGKATVAAAKPKSGGTLTVDGGPIPTLDPSVGSANAMSEGGEAIYDSLMTIPKLGDPAQPNIATSMTASKNGLTWTMKLPTGVKFSDGTAFNASAVVFNMKRDMAPSSSAAALLSSVKSVSAPNKTTVVFHMKTPYSSFPDVFAYDGSGTAGFIASPAAVRKWGKNYSAHASGVGPFKVQSWSPDGQTVLVRNPNYWDKAQQKVYLNKVVIINSPADETAYQSVQAGNLDLMGTEDPSVLQAAKSNGKVRVVMGDSSANEDSIILNFAQPPFNNLSMRQAVSMALNRTEIAKLSTDGLGTAAYNLFPKGNPFHDSSSDPAYNPAKAAALVAAYTKSTGSAPTFNYTCEAGNSATDVIVQELQAVGFKVTTDQEQATGWLDDFFAKKYQAICWVMAPFATPDELPYRFFYSTGDLNTQGFNNAAFDKYADEGRDAATPALQKKYWDAADKVLTQQLPWVWTTTGPIGFIMTKNVQGEDYSDPARLRYFVPSVNLEWLS